MTGGLRRVAAVSSWLQTSVSLDSSSCVLLAPDLCLSGQQITWLLVVSVKLLFPGSAAVSKRQTGEGGRNQGENSNFTTQGSNFCIVFVACSMTVLLL